MKDNRPLVILGSARKDGDTRKLVDRIFTDLKYELIDLLDYRIFPYNYSNNYPQYDNFLHLIELLLRHDKVVFATPVYWYSMSGQMKTFFDRLTDLVSVEKELGRQLKGKNTFLISVGTDNHIPDGFEVPFRLTSEYLKMEFVSVYYCKTDNVSGILTDTNEIMKKIKRIQPQGEP